MIIARRAHPVAPAFMAPVIGLGTPVVTFQVNATQGGVFDVQTLDSTTNSTNFSWKTVYTITNTFGAINIPNDTSIEVKGRWYRLHARWVILLKQFLILQRHRRRAPNLRTSHRLFFGFCALLLSPRRLMRTSIILPPPCCASVAGSPLE